MPMNNNSAVQIINSEKAVSEILSKFSTDFIFDLIDDTIKMKWRPFSAGPVNYAVVLENEFQIAEYQNPSFRDQIEDVRGQTHREIIQRICMYYNLNFTGEQYEDYTPDQLANVSAILFDIFVSNFTQRLVWFFGRYILDNKDDIYNSIADAEELKKNKDATAYGRKIYTDPKLVVIHANLNEVLTNIAGHDIPLNTLLYYLIDQKTAEYLTTILEDCGDIYKYHYASYINDEITRPDLFTMVKFELQGMADKTVNPADVSASS